MLPCVNCCDTPDIDTPMPIALAPAPFIALAYMSENSARAAFAPKVLELATLLPITSRFLLVALSPERPCWKLIGESWWGGSVEGFDLGVGDFARALEIERQRVAAGADRGHAVAHQRSAAEHCGAAHRGHAEAQVGVAAALAGV